MNWRQLTHEEKKDRIIISLIIGIIVLAVFCCVALSFWMRSNKRLENAGSVILAKDSTIEYFKSKSGKTVSVTPAAVVDKDQFKEYYPELVKTITDLKIKLKDLNSIVVAGFQAHGESSGRIDTLVVFSSDSLKWANRTAIVGDRFYTDSLFWNTGGKRITSKFTYQDSIIMTFHVKRNGLFKAKTLEASSSLSNPNARVLNQTAVKVEEFKDKRFGVGVMVGYDPFHNSPGVMVGVGYNLFKF